MSKRAQTTFHDDFMQQRGKVALHCFAWVARSDTAVFWAAHTFPNQSYRSCSRDILKLLQRNFCGPTHKSDFSCRGETLEDWPAVCGTVHGTLQCSPRYTVVETHGLLFYLACVWFEVLHCAFTYGKSHVCEAKIILSILISFQIFGLVSGFAQQRWSVMIYDLWRFKLNIRG